jgi:ATP-dependent Lhr-like helicase
MMGVKNAKRQPLWVQRLRSSQMLDSVIKEDKHPLIRETKRECLEDHWDLEGVEFVLKGIRSGTIQVHEMYMDTPSPMSLPLRRQTEASMMYDYAPTPHSIHRATEDALQQVELAQAGTLITPAKEQLKQQMERKRLPQDENQLHSLLMIEGDIIAGEVDVPIDWFESLARKERVKYIEPGLWIAAEHSDAYQAALDDKDVTVRMDIVRRVLRYRQAQSLELIAERYLFTDGEALEVLEALCRQGSIVESNGLYYHAELYDRARKETVKSLRRQIKTLPAERYAALITSRIRSMTPAKEQLEKAMKVLCDQAFPPEVWEDILLPARVSGYRPELLEELLARGDLFWRITSDKRISFHLYNDINWDEELSSVVEELEENEKVIYEALLKRGASFAQRLSPLLSGVSPYDILLNLAEKGLVSADSFVPARQWMAREKQKKITVRQKVTARVKAMSAGRWEVLRPLKELSVEEQLERLFDKVIIVCRETIQGISWNMALETLRVWEYTGRVRRGYFIEGLSGIQFIRTKDFEGVMTELIHPLDQVVWLCAVDTAQPWGKSLPHMKDRSFHNVSGTTVALRSGVPIAVFERQGKVLRIFDSSNLQEVLRNFSQDFKANRILPKSKRITVKEYQAEAVDALIDAGFSREMQDYVLYR